VKPVVARSEREAPNELQRARLVLHWIARYGKRISIGVCARSYARGCGEVPVVSVVEKIEGFHRDDRVIAFFDLERLLQARIDAVVVTATEAIALDDPVPIPSVIADL